MGASFGTLTALEEAASAGLLWRGAGAAGCGIAPSGLSAFGLGTGATGATGQEPLEESLEEALSLEGQDLLFLFLEKERAWAWLPPGVEELKEVEVVAVDPEEDL